MLTALYLEHERLERKLIERDGPDAEWDALASDRSMDAYNDYAMAYNELKLIESPGYDSRKEWGYSKDVKAWEDLSWATRAKLRWLYYRIDMVMIEEYKRILAGDWQDYEIG